MSVEDRTEAMARRDAGLKAWFEEETGRRLLSDDSQTAIMSLTREVCGLKLAQSQLVANESAARTRLAAAQKQEAVLQHQVQVAFPSPAQGSSSAEQADDVMLWFIAWACQCAASNKGTRQKHMFGQRYDCIECSNNVGHLSCSCKSFWQRRSQAPAMSESVDSKGRLGV